MASPKGKLSSTDVSNAGMATVAGTGVAAVSALIVLILERSTMLITGEGDRVIWVAGIFAILTFIINTVSKLATDTREAGTPPKKE